MKHFAIISFALSTNLALIACEKNRNPEPSPANPNHLGSSETQPEGGSGTIRNQLPANGAAATGQGNTSSTTSAASGAVSDQAHSGQATEKYEQGTAPVSQEKRP